MPLSPIPEDIALPALRLPISPVARPALSLGVVPAPLASGSFSATGSLAGTLTSSSRSAWGRAGILANPDIDRKTRPHAPE
ncbi:hypothetical protein [Haliangium sp. UPWRP_2]|uniref:hypothetical protein n=1 Tax=Haliangium sp. UPWRP_2 TaxID=1931276 RepID=UPI000B545BC2|nr:hypothetical protein [Haliangium sp. UPWRP_2]PSM31358.1 hypothetical protein BVG81_005815 [Haliangium sp. UPWRP_2]